MSRCLNEARIRAAADGEATEIERGHIEGCAECSARVTAADGAGREFAAMVSRVEPPANLTTRVARALAADHPRAGATTLRDFPSPRWGGRVLATAGLVAAAVLAVVFLLPPLDAPRTLSAAQILDRSLRTMTPASGTELREFDLELRLPRVVANHAGTYRIEQLVDHDAPGRYRIVRYSPDGTVLSAISEEPAAGRRTAVVRADGQTFAFRFTIDPGQPLGLRELERDHVEAVIRLLQAAAGQTVSEVDTGRGRRYVVELPQVADTGASGFWELSRARVVVDAADFQILELTASGSYMSDPFSVSFRLRRRTVRPSTEVSADQFQIPLDPDAIVIEAPGTQDVGQDLLAGALRELVRSKWP
jgi:hypothetical protein